MAVLASCANVITIDATDAIRLHVLSTSIGLWTVKDAAI